MTETNKEWIFINSLEEIKELKGKKLNVLVNTDECNYSKEESIKKSKVKTLKFKPRANINLGGLSIQSEVVFGTGSSIDLYAVGMEVADLSKCSNVKMNSCAFGADNRNYADFDDFEQHVDKTKELKFSKNSNVIMQDCFIGSDYKKVTFGKDSTVLMKEGNFSCREMEFPQGANVEIVNSELDGVEKLTFGEGTNITIKNTRIDTLDYPDRDFTEIDFSKCAHVEIINSNLNSVKKIKFKDKEQEEEIMKGVEWEGKIIYDKTLVIDMRDIINREFN